MKTAVYLGKEHIEIIDSPLPEVGADDVLVRNIYSSICGTDAAVYAHGPGTGHKVDIGGEFGHETISVIVETGENIKEFEAGQRVYPYPRFAKNDTKRAGTIGGFSEYMLIPHAKLNHSLYFVPAAVSDKTACLIEPFTVGTRAARRSLPKPGEKAVVFGCGTIGLAAAIALKWFGLDRVMLCDVSDFRLSKAKALGFEVCSAESGGFTSHAGSFFGYAPALYGQTFDADIFIDAAGADSVLELFMKQGKIESRFVSVAVSNTLRSLDLLHLTYAQKSIIGSGGYMPEDVKEVLAIMESGRFDIESIITQEFPLNHLAEALRTAADTEHSLNVIIDFSKDCPSQSHTSINRLSETLPS